MQTTMGERVRRRLAIGKNFTRSVEVVPSPNQGKGVRRTVEKVKAKKLSILIKILAFHHLCLLYYIVLVV